MGEAGGDRLDAAVAALLAWRAEHTSGVVVTDDARWIEARLEERVAVMRFEEPPHETIRTRALTGEPIDEIIERDLARAARGSSAESERAATELREHFKPPIIPSAEFLRAEVLLSEAGFCVLLTRHRHACIVVGRAGDRNLVDGIPPKSPSYIGSDDEPLLDGWAAHEDVFAALEPFRLSL